jgi:hypothetical protein
MITPTSHLVAMCHLPIARPLITSPMSHIVLEGLVQSWFFNPNLKDWNCDQSLQFKNLIKTKLNH